MWHLPNFKCQVKTETILNAQGKSKHVRQFGPQQIWMPITKWVLCAPHGPFCHPLQTSGHRPATGFILWGPLESTCINLHFKIWQTLVFRCLAQISRHLQLGKRKKREECTGYRSLHIHQMLLLWLLENSKISWRGGWGWCCSHKNTLPCMVSIIFTEKALLILLR